jgi:hypothetical protein
MPSAPQISGNAPVCLGGILQLTASEVPGAFYFWQGPDGFTTVDRQLVRINAVPSFSGTYSVFAQLGNCSSSVATVQVSVITPPLLPAISGPSNVCAGQNLQLSAQAEPGATFRWSGPGGFSSSLQNPQIIGVTTQNSGVYSLQTALGNCFSPTATFTVTVTPRPELSGAGSNSPLCAGSNLQLTASTFVGASYSWSGPGGFTSFEQNPIIENATPAASGVYSVTAFIGACSSTTRTVAAAVNANPQAPNLTANTPVCEGQTLVLNATPISGATYNWQGPSGFSRVTTTPTLVIANPTAGSGGTYRVFAIANDCPSPLASAEVQVRPINARFVSSNATICSDGQAPFILELEGRGPWNVTYNINGGPSDVLTFGAANSPSPFTVNTTVTVNRSSVYNLVRVTDSNGCSRNLRDSLRITVRNSGIQLVAGNDGPKCPGSALQLSVNNVPNAAYRWSGPNNYASSLQNPILSPLSLANAGVYSVVAIVEGCTSQPATTVVNVTNNAAANLGNTQFTVCQGQPVSVPVNLSGSAPWRIAYRVNNGPVTEIPNILSSPYNIALNFSSSGEYTLELVDVKDGAACPGGSFAGSATIRVNPNPTLTVISRSDATCGNNARVVVGASGGSGNYAFSLDGRNFNNTTGIFEGLVGGDYSITARDGACQSTLSVRLEPAPLPVITTAQFSANTITLNWRGVPGAVSYSIRYKVAGTSANPQVVGGITQTSAQLTNLEANTTYELCVQALCSGGSFSECSETRLVSTALGGSTTCATPQGATVSNITRTSAILSWQPIASGAVCYIVNWGLLSQDPSAWTSVLLPAPSTSVQLSTLEPGKEYGFRVRANCSNCSPTSGNLSAPGSIVSFTSRARLAQATPATGRWQVYPNPSSGNFTLSWQADAGEEITAELRDLRGKKVMSRALISKEGLNEASFQLETLPKGVYVLEALSGGQKYVQKIIIH